MWISPSQPSPLACLLSRLYNGTACLAKPCFTQENRPHIGAWSNRCPALYQHSASFSLPDSLFMHRGFICFNEKPRAKLQVFVFVFFFLRDHFIECVQIFTLETKHIAKHVQKTWVPWPNPTLIRGSLCTHQCVESSREMEDKGESRGYSSRWTPYLRLANSVPGWHPTWILEHSRESIAVSWTEINV